MNRKDFLKSLGILIGSAVIPKQVLPVTDFIEKRSTLNSKSDKKFVNHMTIQRKTIEITGTAQKAIIFCNFNEEPIHGFMPLDEYNKLKNKTWT